MQWTQKKSCHGKSRGRPMTSVPTDKFLLTNFPVLDLGRKRHRAPVPVHRFRLDPVKGPTTLDMRPIHTTQPKKKRPPTTNGVLDIRNAPYLNSLPITPYHAVIPRRSSKSSLFLGAGHSCEHWGFRFPRVRVCILSISWATSPASPASSVSAPAKDVEDASNAGDVACEAKSMEMNDMKWNERKGTKTDIQGHEPKWRKV